MKKAYQIDERRAIERFRAHLLNDDGAVQMILPLAEIAQRLRSGVGQFLLQAQLQLLMLIMEDEVDWMTGPQYARGGPKDAQRWGGEDGSVVINGQKVPVRRPRVRGERGDVKIGSYELFRREEEQQQRVWEAITRGLTMRGYGPTVRESPESFAIEKSAVSEKFVAMSGHKVAEFFKRDLGKLRLCALLLDGVEVKQQHIVTALGIDEVGRKTILGFHQGASENQAACDALFSDLAGRGLNFRHPHLNIIDGSKALRSGVRKYCGEASPILRCQLHKRRNIVGHFADEDQPGWDRKLANAYDLRSYREARAGLLRIQDELNHVNPSAARSLEEGLEETLTLHKLKVPVELWKTLRSTNVIESAFSIVRVICRNVKRWRPGNQIERWVGSGLLVAEKQFRRIDGYRALPGLFAALEANLKQPKSAARVA
ncbi:MAG TPA: transposase [Candidatus Methylomirabilis sp.]|nr:transposase [Candidatus Methylomirabilis sp.]